MRRGRFATRSEPSAPRPEPSATGCEPFSGPREPFGSYPKPSATSSGPSATRPTPSAIRSEPFAARRTPCGTRLEPSAMGSEPFAARPPLSSPRSEPSATRQRANPARISRTNASTSNIVVLSNIDRRLDAEVPEACLCPQTRPARQKRREHVLLQGQGLPGAGQNAPDEGGDLGGTYPRSCRGGPMWPPCPFRAPTQGRPYDGCALEAHS